MVSRALPDQAASGLAVQESGGPPRADGAPKRTEGHVYNRIRWRVVYEDREQEVGDHLQDLPRAPSDEADDRARHERPAAGDEQWQHATMLGQLRGEGHQSEGRQKVREVIVEDPLVEEPEDHARQVEHQAHGQRHQNEPERFLQPPSDLYRSSFPARFGLSPGSLDFPLPEVTGAHCIHTKFFCLMFRVDIRVRPGTQDITRPAPG